jgi:lipoate---protein ligase
VSWRLIRDDGATAVSGLATDDHLMRAHGKARMEPTLRLYTYRSHCALVGRFQVTEAEVDLGACRELGIDVGRRPTGGGAILMGEGQLGIALATSLPPKDAPARPRALLQRYAAAVADGLAALGMRASFGGKNDLLVDGRKIAGLGLALDGGGGLLFHASVLADLDIALMLRVLRLPVAGLGPRAVSAVERRLTTATRELGRSVRVEELRAAVADGFARAFGARYEERRLDEHEQASVALIARERYADPAWVFQRRVGDDREGSAELRTPAGSIRVDVALAGGVLKSVLVSGDFPVASAAIPSFESALRWKRPTLEVLRAEAIAALGAASAGVAPETLAETVWLACADARAVRGSCYYPDPAPAAVGAGRPGGAP